MIRKTSALPWHPHVWYTDGESPVPLMQPTMKLWALVCPWPNEWSIIKCCWSNLLTVGESRFMRAPFDEVSRSSQDPISRWEVSQKDDNAEKLMDTSANDLVKNSSSFETCGIETTEDSVWPCRHAAIEGKTLRRTWTKTLWCLFTQ